jgi:hypothetical protein
MKTVSIYRLSDGALTGAQIAMSPWNDAVARAHLPAGHAFIDGAHDHRKKRVHVASGQIVDYAQPKDPDHDRRRAAFAQSDAKRKAQLEIDTLERSSQRAARELAIDPTNASARARLVDVEAQIAERRKQLV